MKKISVRYHEEKLPQGLLFGSRDSQTHDRTDPYNTSNIYLFIII